MIKVFLTGKTFDVRFKIKAEGFRWNPTAKAWVKTYEDSEKQDAEALRNRWAGVIFRAKQVANEEKRYLVKESWIFNLESMHDKIFCLSYDMREGKLTTPFVVANTTINDEDDLFALLDEADALRCKASRPVSGKDYGRIKEIVSWRVEQRYARCMASGMSEAEAGRCFEDM